MPSEYVPGLEGIVAAQTEISLVDGANGQLVYRGYVIADLAEEISFEEVAHLLNVRIDLEVELDRRVMCLRELLQLEPGGLLRMTRSAGENIDILAGGAIIGSAEIVIIEENFGVRITDFLEA